MSAANHAGRLLRSPLLHFFVLGSLAFALQAARADKDERARIDISEASVQMQLMRRAELTGRAQSETDRQQVIDALVRDQLLERQARLAGLDHGDAIVSRRLTQKMEFLLSQLAKVEPPTDAELGAYLATQQARYRIEGRLTLEHIFFSGDRRDDAAGDARQALKQLDGASAAERMALGDPFLHGRKLVNITERRLSEMLGAPAAKQLMSVDNGRWLGPFHSRFGEHLVFVQSKSAARDATVAEVREALVRALDERRRQQVVERQIARWRSEVEVVISEPAGRKLALVQVAP